MHTPELAPERLEALLRGAPPETTSEALVERLVRELRSDAPTSSAALRERVHGIAQRPAPRRMRIRVNVRALAVAGVLAALVAGGGYLVAQPGPSSSDASGEMAEAGHEDMGAAVGEVDRSAKEAYDSARGEHAVQGSATTVTGGGAGNVPPSSGRARDVDMSLELRVRDAEAVSEAANEAMRVVDRLGGHVVGSAVRSRGSEGSARLGLRVPVGRLEDAVLRLSSLGTITSQDVQVEDLQESVDRRESRMESLQRLIRRDRLRLASGTLTAEERLEAQLRLDSLRAQLRSVRRDRAELLRRAASAEITLLLHTRAAPAGDEESGGLSGTAGDAWSIVSGAGAVALFALIVLSPLLVLGTLLWLLLRARGRRIEQRLLDEPRPAGPS